MCACGNDHDVILFFMRRNGCTAHFVEPWSIVKCQAENSVQASGAKIEIERSKGDQRSEAQNKNQNKQRHKDNTTQTTTDTSPNETRVWMTEVTERTERTERMEQTEQK